MLNPLPQDLHGLPIDRVLQQLVEVLFKAAGGPLLEHCIHLDEGLHPGALPKAKGPVNIRETHAKREVELQDTVAHNRPCKGGWVPAFQPQLAPSQRQGGCAGTLSSTFFGPSWDWS